MPGKREVPHTETLGAGKYVLYVHEDVAFVEPTASVRCPSQNAPDFTRAAPDFSPAAPDFSQAAPDFSQAAPDFSQAAPDFSQAAPDFDPAAPDFDQVAPDFDQVAPDSAAPDFNPAAPNFNQAAPDFNPAAPDFNQAAPDINHADLTTTESSWTTQLLQVSTKPFLTLTPRCEGCDLKTAENTALQMNVNMWRDRALAAEEELRILKASTPAKSSSEHYKPLRGFQIPKCNYVLLNAKGSIPPGYQLLAEGTRLAVPSTWYVHVMGKTCHTSTAFRLKKVMDGFFTPEDIGCKPAAQFKRNNEAVLQAIEVFGITTLHLFPSQFSDQLSKKICSWRKAYKNLGSQNVNCRSEGVFGLLR